MFRIAKYVSFLALLCFPLSMLCAGGYTASRVAVPLSGTAETASGYLLVPDCCAGSAQTKCPAVLVLHDHGAWFAAGKEKMVSPQAIAEAEHGARKVVCERQLRKQIVERLYAGAYLADTLASRGYVVLCIDALYWGERAVSLPETETDDNALKEYNATLKQYQSSFYSYCVKTYHNAWFEKVLSDDKFCVTYLSALPFVDASRIACFGFSYGAYRSWQLAAEDKRVALCAAANWMTTLKANGGPLPNVSAYSMFRPYRASQPHNDYPDVAALVAPRPFLLIYGTRDRLFPLSAAEECVNRISEAYKACGSESTFRAMPFDDDHRFGDAQREALLTFLTENL